MGQRACSGDKRIGVEYHYTASAGTCQDCGGIEKAENAERGQ